jgi:hypothetical protein
LLQLHQLSYGLLVVYSTLTPTLLAGRSSFTVPVNTTSPLCDVVLIGPGFINSQTLLSDGALRSSPSKNSRLSVLQGLLPLIP